MIRVVLPNTYISKHVRRLQPKAIELVRGGLTIEQAFEFVVPLVHTELKTQFGEDIRIEREKDGGVIFYKPFADDHAEEAMLFKLTMEE